MLRQVRARAKRKIRAAVRLGPGPVAANASPLMLLRPGARGVLWCRWSQSRL